MRHSALCAVALALVALSSPAVAQSDPLEAEAVRIYKMLPRHSTILQIPSVDVWTSYGEGAVKTVRADVPGGQARRFTISAKGANPWDAAIQAPNAVTVSAGDVIHASFWARASKLPKGKSVARVPTSLQKNAEPYTQISFENIDLTEEWQLVSIAGESPADYGMGGMVLNLQAAADKQVIEVGPVFINNLGPGSVPSVNTGVGAQASAEPAASAPKSALNAGPMDLDALPSAMRKDVRDMIKRLPKGAVLISDPRVEEATAYGGSHRIVDDRGAPGGRALEVTTPKRQIESWHVGVNLPVTDNIGKDDVVLLAVWAKAIDAQNESQTATLQPMRIQESVPPHTSAAEGAAYLSREWELYYLPAKASDPLAAGPAGVTYHLGLNPQTVRIGPSYVFKFPRGTDPRTLPMNEINYEGREDGARWRKAAMDRIDQHRKADLTIRVTDAAGNPMPGADVRVEQVDHAFHFGAFPGHEFTTPTTSDERNWQRVFFESFNTATLPVYWADWGWSDKDWSHTDDYKAAIRYVARKGVPWRAHTVMWPGENYMPERMLEETDVAKRRAMVEAQVREVMTHIRDAEFPPFAVDFTNEPRANRYFQENGDPDLVVDMFNLAHEIAPDLPLFINDYGILNNGGMNQAAIDYYHQWLREHIAKGVPLGGIGFQGHFAAGLTPPEKVIEILKDFTQYGLPLHITEFDIETLDEGAQADYTRDAIIAALSVPEVEAFIFWGFWEARHWKPNAAMIRSDWSEKPAYGAVRDLMYDTLWTDKTVQAGDDGVARVRGMHGDYRVTVKGQTKTISLGEGGAEVRF